MTQIYKDCHSVNNSFNCFLLKILLLLLLLLKKIVNARPESDLRPISPTTPAPNLQRERRERENSRRQKGIEQLRPIKKYCTLLLKRISPTPSNTLPARSIRRDTERKIKVMRGYCVLVRGGALVYRCATKAPRVTRTVTCSTGSASLRGCIGLHLNLYSIHNTLQMDDAKYHTQTDPLLKNGHHSLKSLYGLLV